MKSIQLSSILFITTILSSCFEIIEDVKINADGSGTLKYIINFSQSSDKIKSLLSAGDIDRKKIPNESELKADFEKICNTTKKANGISRVVYTSDFNEFIFTYKADFKNLNNINAAIDSIKSSRGDDSLGFTYFNFDKKSKTFNRKGDDIIEKLRSKMSS